MRRLGLPTRPQKETTHRRPDDPNWAVELDALSGAQLREALTVAVDRCCSPRLREAALKAQAADKASLDVPR